VDLVPVYQYGSKANATEDHSDAEEEVKQEEYQLLQTALVDVDKPKIMKVPTYLPTYLPTHTRSVVVCFLINQRF
jgi:hypothetical protein